MTPLREQLEAEVERLREEAEHADELVEQNKVRHGLGQAKKSVYAKWEADGYVRREAADRLEAITRSAPLTDEARVRIREIEDEAKRTAGEGYTFLMGKAEGFEECLREFPRSAPSGLEEAAREALPLRVKAPDPEGETYEDGSCDLLGDGEWPAVIPLDRTKVALHIAGCDIDLTEPELAWLIEDGGPQLLARLRTALGEQGGADV